MSDRKHMPDYFQRRSIRTEPYFLKKNHQEQREIIQKPYTRPMAAQHLAAIRIQNNVKAYLAFLRKHPERSKAYKRGMNDDNVSHPDHHFTAAQKLRSKFLTSAYNILHKSEEGCFQNFCAAKIQATFKMALTRLS